MSQILNSANVHKDGGPPYHDPRNVIVFDVADPKDGACPAPSTPRGGRGNL